MNEFDWVDGVLGLVERLFDNAGLIALGWILHHEVEAAGLPWWGFYFGLLLVVIFGVPLWLVSHGFRPETGRTATTSSTECD